MIESEIDSCFLLWACAEGCLAGIFHDRSFLEDTGMFFLRKTTRLSRIKSEQISETQILRLLQELTIYLIPPPKNLYNIFVIEAVA